MRNTVQGILSKFDKMIVKLEKAVAENNQQIDRNAEDIRSIQEQNASLNRENEQGYSAIKKLRELTGQE